MKIGLAFSGHQLAEGTQKIVRIEVQRPFVNSNIGIVTKQHIVIDEKNN